jgi:proteasome beta subunit
MMENNTDPLEINDELIEKAIKTGTTTVGIIVKDGVVVATESQATGGMFVASKTAQKLFKINNFACATISGGVADCQYVISLIKANSKLKQVEEEEVPEPKYVASLTRNILFSGRSYFLAMMIVGGYSEKEGKGKLFGIDLLGTLYEEEKYISFGSGSPYSLGVLEADWKPNMTTEEGIELVKSAISSSRERDAGSGHKFQICVIDKDGYKKIE